MKKVYIYIYIYIYIYTNLPVDVIVRLPHPRSGDSQGQETFLAPSADKQTRNYDNIYIYIYIYMYIYIYILFMVGIRSNLTHIHDFQQPVLLP